MHVKRENLMDLKLIIGCLSARFESIFKTQQLKNDSSLLFPKGFKFFQHINVENYSTCENRKRERDLL